jgi:hypothetical protein
MSEPSQHTIYVLRYAERQHHSHAVVEHGEHANSFHDLSFEPGRPVEGR